MPQPGEVWIADIPFTSGTASKLRPVLVLWTDAADVVVAAITSAQPRTTTDVALPVLCDPCVLSWQKMAQLPVQSLPSRVRPCQSPIIGFRVFGQYFVVKIPP
jgi:hypothetical protein